jgi:hypothetical protein
MSGRKITDHAFFAGGPSKESVLPVGNKVKLETSAEGAGHLGMEYPDTTEMVRRDQMSGDKKAKAHKIKEGYRN